VRATEFWLASVSGCMSWPRPRPSTNMPTKICHSGVSYRMRVSEKKPTAVKSVAEDGRCGTCPCAR
jgi:hypothetical protein